MGVSLVSDAGVGLGVGEDGIDGSYITDVSLAYIQTLSTTISFIFSAPSHLMSLTF